MLHSKQNKNNILRNYWLAIFLTTERIEFLCFYSFTRLFGENRDEQLDASFTAMQICHLVVVHDEIGNPFGAVAWIARNIFSSFETLMSGPKRPGVPSGSRHSTRPDCSVRQSEPRERQAHCVTTEPGNLFLVQSSRPINYSRSRKDKSDFASCILQRLRCRLSENRMGSWLPDSRFALRGWIDKRELRWQQSLPVSIRVLAKRKPRFLLGRLLALLC